VARTRTLAIPAESDLRRVCISALVNKEKESPLKRNFPLALLVTAIVALAILFLPLSEAKRSVNASKPGFSPNSGMVTVTNGANTTFNASLVPAQVTTQFCNTAPITINDAAPATPYPSNITVSGLTGKLSNLTIDFVGVSHTFPDNIQALVVGPTGQKVNVMTNAGDGTGIVGANFTFDDNAAAYLADTTALAAGTFKPSSYGNIASFPAPAPTTTEASPYRKTLSNFFNSNPNGTWSLYVQDIAAPDAGTIAGGWCLNVTTTSSSLNCPATTLAGSLAAGDLTMTGRITRDGVTSLCTSVKAYPGTQDAIAGRRYDAYTFTNSTTASQCVTASLTSGCGITIFLVAYSGSFDPANLATNYLADNGSSFLNTSSPMSFSLAPGATVVLVVHEITAGAGCASYGLVVERNSCALPTASGAMISGRITTPDGSPLGGAVMHLSGAASRTTISDGAGNYRFENVDTDNFYTVTPSLANYHFAPASRSFSLVGNITDAAFTANADASQSANAIDTTEYFVRQQYLDFLGREPDQGGLEYWSAQINQCNGDAACISQRRIDVSAAFFASAEFQQTGSYIYGVYAGTLGRTLNYDEFNADRSQVLGGSGLDPAKTAFAESFVQRPEFINRYPQGMSREQFVDAVIQTMTQRSGVGQSSLRDGFLNDYDAGGRALVVRHAAEASSFVAPEYNKAFVLMEYFGYLRREIDQGGYDYWLEVLNNGAAGNYRGMVCAFLTSTEYQLRFSTVVTRNNAECS
jgi:hypothetical protein